MELQNSLYLPAEPPLTKSRGRHLRSWKPAIDRAQNADKAYSISSFAVIDLNYLRHHRINGQVIYPAAGYSMAGISIHQILNSTQKNLGPLVLQNLKFRKPLSLEEDQTATLQLGYESSNGEFTVLSRGSKNSGQPVKHAVGQITESDTPSNQIGSGLDELQGNFKEYRSVDSFYQALRGSGLDYGTFFKRISSIRLNQKQDEALSKLDVHPELTNTSDRWAQRITLLDSAFQSLAATLKAADRNLYIPSRIQTLRILDDFESDLWCHARLVKSTSRSVVGDLTLFDVYGNRCVEISGLHCLKIPFKHRP